MHARSISAMGFLVLCLTASTVFGQCGCGVATATYAPAVSSYTVGYCAGNHLLCPRVLHFILRADYRLLHANYNLLHTNYHLLHADHHLLHADHHLLHSDHHLLHANH